jgi:hypothetical protein
MTQSLRKVANLDWPWKSEDPAIHIILVSDEQFTNLANHPDQAIERVFPQDPEPISLREHCQRGAERGATKLLIAYDYFFGGNQRSLYPDSPVFQDTLKKVGDVAREYGLGLEPSILSPLELGVGYRARSGEAGRWMHYREGLRDTQTGSYSVTMWQHTRWCNNKGPTPVNLIGVRAFAFRETHIPHTYFFAVDPQNIVELPTPDMEPMPGTGVGIDELPGGIGTVDSMFAATRVRIHGAGGETGLNRVLVVLLYETMEMDYFSPSAPAFMRELVQQYRQRDIDLAGIYSDEMHIQQDWSYHTHFDAGQFNMRYVSKGFEQAFAARFGERYADFAPYLLYFTAHQHDFLPTHEPKLPSQHVFGPQIEDMKATLRFRRDYYHFLESGVVKLVNDARENLEALGGHELDAFYHATWAESPTCDAWAPGGIHESWSALEHRSRYEYTPDFLWSNTVHQASAACANYFLWNDFLTGGNNDVPEGGYADRDYYARALACSLAALNRRPLASAGMWGMPEPVAERMMAVSQVFGALGHPAFRAVQDYAPRSVEVLFLYPQDLVSVEERFGSWMSLYGYANYITAEKLVEHGRATDDGYLQMKGARYRTICALYEPFPTPELRHLLLTFVQRGGTVIWSSIPPQESAEGLAWMEQLFGAHLLSTPDPLGQPLPGRQVTFGGALQSVSLQTILTDFVVDRVFAVQPASGAEPIAALETGGPQGRICVGTRKEYPSGGQALYLGFRPRDDQAACTGTEARTWFEVLRACGAYPATSELTNEASDNPTVLSRTGDLLVCAFPNGALAMCPHFKDYPENWPGGFFRDEEADRRLMLERPVAPDTIDLCGWQVAGQTVSFQGRHALAWRLADGMLKGFAGYECSAITIDGKTYRWADVPVDIGWHPLSAAQATPEYVPLFRVWCNTPASIHVPLNLRDDNIQVWRGAYAPWGDRARRGAHGRAGYADCQVPFVVSASGDLEMTIDEQSCGCWLYVVRPSAA